jgi:hypothetical protein
MVFAQALRFPLQRLDQTASEVLLAPCWGNDDVIECGLCILPVVVGHDTDYILLVASDEHFISLNALL